MAEDAALTGHWLHCEHSRSAMEEWPAAAVPVLSGAQGRRPDPSAASIHIEEDLAGSGSCLPDPSRCSMDPEGRGMIEAAEGAALAGHWLRCEHSRSVMAA